MFIINSSFIGGYKLGDNINHNLQTLTPLYAAYDQADAKTRRLLCKPIILIIVSVLEAVLHDFHNRIKLFTAEGIKNLAEDVIAAIRSKKMDKFEHYIEETQPYTNGRPAFL